MMSLTIYRVLIAPYFYCGLFMFGNKNELQCECDTDEHTKE